MSYRMTNKIKDVLVFVSQNSSVYVEKNDEVVK